MSGQVYSTDTGIDSIKFSDYNIKITRNLDLGP